MAQLQAKAAAEEQGRIQASTQITVRCRRWGGGHLLAAAAAVALVPCRRQPASLTHGCCALPQALEAALLEARQEAAGLAQLREQLAGAAEREAVQAVNPLQAGTAAMLLPLVQLAYFSLRVVLWLSAGMARLGFN